MRGAPTPTSQDLPADKDVQTYPVAKAIESTTPCFLNIVTTRRCQSAFPYGLNEEKRGYHCHSMGDATRSETKSKPTFEGKPLLVEAAPIMAPRFEQTLHHTVNPTLEGGSPVAVFCIPSGRKVTQTGHMGRPLESALQKQVQLCSTMSLCVRQNTTRASYGMYWD